MFRERIWFGFAVFNLTQDHRIAPTLSLRGHGFRLGVELEGAAATG